MKRRVGNFILELDENALLIEHQDPFGGASWKESFSFPEEDEARFWLDEFRGDEDLEILLARKHAGGLGMGMIRMGQRRDEVVMNLVAPQYRVLMEALEAVATGRWPSEELQRKASDLWERLLVDGGHVSVKELKSLKKALEVCPPKETPKV